MHIETLHASTLHTAKVLLLSPTFSNRPPFTVASDI